ncbi:phBC6A51 family helix-turn-helix protein [Peribacillus muralis]|uniref:phBC6A51 family helix-turn-helix protein n=1 Tax=Peribacillus muralis TaxID=264697 RepID=UPI00366CFF6F
MKRTLNVAQKKFVDLVVDDNLYTNEQLAEQCGVDVRTVYRWKRDEDVGAEVERLADAGLKININRAYGVLQDILFNPDTPDKDRIKALDLYLKTQGKLKDKTEVDTKITVSSKEQAEAELEELLNM